MLKRFNRLLAVLLIVALSLYVVLINRENITVYLSPSNAITTSAGVIVIAVFCLGILFATTVALFFGLRAYLRERTYKRKERQWKSFEYSIIQAKSFLAAGEWGRAQEEWNKILRKDTSHLIARVELSRSLEMQGNIREALRIIDQARTVSPHNIEVLFRAAELHVALGNKTAAIDNLALVMYHHPSKKAAMLARDLSEDLGRLEDALEYHAQLEKLSGPLPESIEVISRLELKQILRDFSTDQNELIAKLRVLARRFPESFKVLQGLAVVEQKTGNTDGAAQLLIKAAKISGDSTTWREAMNLWIINKMPERALATARSASKETKGKEKIAAELELIRLYLNLDMLEESKQALDKLPPLAKTEGVTLTSEQAHSLLLLKGFCLNRLGFYKEATEIWMKLSNEDVSLSSLHIKSGPSPNGDAPSPRLSTP